MAVEYLASNEFPGDGVQTLFNVSFKGNRPDAGSGVVPYLSPSDVKAQEVTPATPTTAEVVVDVACVYVGPNQFSVTPAVPTGKIVRIYRATQDEYALVDYQSLQTVGEADLDLSNRQVVFITQESHDLAVRASASAADATEIAYDAITVANAATAAAAAAQAGADTAIATSQTALNVANTAADDAAAALAAAAAAEAHASSADTAAANAQTAANTANVNASNASAAAANAVATANGVDAKAQEALDNSADAVTTANNAETTANGIDAKATTALNNSIVANTTANNAQDDATEALDTANGVDAKATTALANSNTAVTAVNTLTSDLANNSNPAKGAALVGYAGTTVAAYIAALLKTADLADTTVGTKGGGLVGYNPSLTYTAGTLASAVADASADSIFELKAMAVFAGKQVNVFSYHSGWAARANGPEGGRPFVWNASRLKSAHNGGTIISNTVPWDGTLGTLAAFLAGTGETTPGGSGSWEAIDKTSNAFQFGAVGDNSQDDYAAIQKGLDSVKVLNLSNATYKIVTGLDFKNNGTHLVGQNMIGTVLNYTGGGNAIRNSASTTTTRLFCGLHDMQINHSTNVGSAVVDWKSFQFGRIENCWIIGASILGCVGINLAANWTVTEGTYNDVTGCYIGLCSVGIQMSDGANNNTITTTRFQTSVSGGQGILINGTAADRVSSITICDNGFEYTGHLNDGINVLTGAKGIRIEGNRFEQLRYGIVIGGSLAEGIKDLRSSNYFSDCTLDINLSAGSTGVQYGIFAAGAFSGASDVGQRFNLNAVSNPTTGTYNFTFIKQPVDTGYTVTAHTNQKVAVMTAKSTAGFTLVTQDGSFTNAAQAFLDVTVFYNK